MTIRVMEYNVLISQDEVSDRTAGGLMKPGDLVEREKHGQTLGRIVGVSPMAFSFDEWPADEPKPQVGDRVIFAQHAGCFVKDEDGTEYRAVKDRDIVAVLA